MKKKYIKPGMRDFSAFSMALGACESGLFVGICGPNGLTAGICTSVGLNAGSCSPGTNVDPIQHCDFGLGDTAVNCVGGYAASP